MFGRFHGTAANEQSRRCFGAFISARKIPFPGNGDRGSQRPVRYQRLLGQSAGDKIHQPRFQVRIIYAALMSMAIDEASAKVRVGQPEDDEADLSPDEMLA